MKIVRNNLLPPRPYTAINLLGVLFVRHDTEISTWLINHERIHTAQMLELWVVPFYVLYLVEWMVKLVRCRFRFHEAYMQLSFEREAYRHMYDPGYIARRKRWAMWRRDIS